MTLRTPRRRISPRTKRRYRVIKEFFKRTLGSNSQQDIKINSSIAVNVTDLKHKILGIESQLTEVSKHCRDLVCLDTSFRKETENIGADAKHIDTKEQSETCSEKTSKSSDTKVLYKNNYRRSDESDYATPVFSGINDRKIITPPNNMHHCDAYVTQIKKKKNKVKDRADAFYDCDPNLRKHKTQSAFDNVTSVYSTNSYHSVGPEHNSPHIDAGLTGHKQRHDKKHVQRREYIEHTPMEEPRHAKQKEHIKRKSDSPPRYTEQKHRSRKTKRGKSGVDQDFITDIIKRQYKPVKLFGRRDSEISQFSAPVCRDQEYSLHEDIQEDEELCSCCLEAHNRSLYTNRVCNHDLSNMRSICDTRLYTSKRNSHIKRHRQHADIYNDATLYDLVPVKEKSSPKSRRKFAEDHNMIEHNCYKEVPPSPRTQRPRLNLKAQYYTEYDDYMVQVKPNRRYHKIRPKKQEYIETMESDITSEITLPKNRREKHKLQKPIKIPSPNPIHQDIGIMSGLPSPTLGNEQNNVALDTTLNKTQETDISDKTDKALCEIKDILQSFLQEIKKEATACDNTKEINDKNTQKHSNGIQQNTGMNAGTILESGQSNFNNQSIPHCSVPPQFIPPFQNPCCYPILPVCPMNPMNCIQSGYMMPSQSFTCHTCAANTKEAVCCDCSKHKNASNEICTPTKPNETDELIKEIYKFVAQSPYSARKKAREDGQKCQKREVDSPETKKLTSRSVDACSRTSKHDAQVGTPTMKCYSKSCEAIGSRMMTDTSYTTTKSDTAFEKICLEVTVSDSELSSKSTVLEKKKTGKFSRVLRSIGLLKKKKKDVIEEISESESSVEMDVKPKVPFRQEVMNYSMYGQEYFHRPPIPPYTHPGSQDGYGPPPGYDPRTYYSDSFPTSSDPYTHHKVIWETIPEHIPSCCHPEHHHPNHHLHRHPNRRSYPPAPPYPNYEANCSHQHPQVPLCLKEIEVKSTGTQSDRKMSFFQKLAKKPQTSGTARSDPIKNCSTQTPQTNNNPPAKPEKPGLFTGWKNLQAQAKGDAANFAAGKFTYKNQKGKDEDTDPVKFSYKTHKKLAEGDMRMRNAVLKKLFYKRNPFSPRNLIVKTLLGKDKSSYGEPQMSFRPRMFF